MNSPSRGNRADFERSTCGSSESVPDSEAAAGAMTQEHGTKVRHDKVKRNARTANKHVNLLHRLDRRADGKTTRSTY